MSTFKVGDTVEVVALRKRGVVIAVLRDGKIRVQIGNLTMSCEGDSLTAVTPDKRASKRGAKSSAIESFPTHQGQWHASTPNKRALPRSIDLHGLTSVDALARLSTWLDAVILAGIDKVTIIHGHGTGKLQAVVHEYLSSLSVIERFKINECNTGETIVYL